MSAIKLQLDTTVLLDAMIEDRPQSDDALAVFEAIIDGAILAQIMPSQLVDYYYITRKAGLSDEERRRSISLFLDYLELCPVDSAFVRAVVESDEPDFEDGMIRQAAESFGADYIVTRDVAGFHGSAVQKIEPSALAALLNLV